MNETDIALAVTQSDVLSCVPSQPVSMPLSIENPSVSLDDPATWDLLSGGASTSSGIRVSETKALTHPAVWQALTMISGDIAALPLEVFREETDGDRIVLESDPLYELVHWQPNVEMNAYRFWMRVIAWKLLWGNSYAFISRRGDGAVDQLIPLLPDRTAPERVGGQLAYVTEVAGRLVPLPPSDVLHFEGLAIDTLAGYHFITAARQAVGLGLAEMDFASKFFRNGGRVGGILELPASTSKPARDKIAEGFAKHYGSNEAFKTVILRENAKFHQAQMSPEQAQVVEARQESTRDVARLFNIRPGKLGEESRSSYASKSEDNKDYHDTTLRPHLRSITQECRSKLLTPTQKRAKHYFRHDTRDLLSMNFTALSEALTKLRSGEIINADEARKILNMNKREDGKGNVYVNPNINVTTKTGTTETDQTDAAAKAFRSLLSSTVQRMARFVANRAKKLSAKPKDFLHWIDEGYEGQRESVTSAVGEIIHAASDVLDINSDEGTASVVDAFMVESKQILQTIAESTAADELKTVVDANMTEWSAEAGDRYANQIFG